MSQSIATIALLVRDYDEAIDWFTRCLGFERVSDEDQGTKRWVVMQPPGGKGAALLLAEVVGMQQASAIGNQAGGRVFLFLETDDFARDHARMVSEGVRFAEAPRVEAYGTVAVFEDLYGNRWDLIEHKTG